MVAKYTHWYLRLYFTLLICLLTVCACVYLSQHVGACHDMPFEVRGQFSPSTMWLLMLKLGRAERVSLPAELPHRTNALVHDTDHKHC